LSGSIRRDTGRQTLLIGAVVVALLAIVAVGLVGRARLGALFGHHQSETPTLMIISRQMLMTTVQTNQQVEATVLGPKAAPNAKGAQANDKSDSNDGRSAGQRQSSQFNVLISSMEDALGGRIAEEFQDSGRFHLVPQAKIVDAMDAYARSNHIPPANLWQYVSGSVTSQTKAGANTTTQDAKEFSHGITDVGRGVGADYTLIVSMGEPNMVQDYVAASPGDPEHLTYSAQPIINCEVFDADGHYAFRFSKQIDHPVATTVYAGPGVPLKGEDAAAQAKLNDRLSQVVARQILEWTLDKIAPAKIVEADSNLVINRGANDGIVQGAVYAVQREVGDDLKDSDDGLSLGKVRKDVGSILIQTVQDRIATASVATGGPFLKGDVVAVAPAAGSESGNVAPPAGALPVAGQTLNVAVDHITSGGADSDALAQTVSAALAGDPHIAVLARAELGKLASERALNARAGGDYGLTPDAGLAQSNYLVEGDCSATSHRHDKTISIAGDSQTVSSSVSTSASCNLRAVAVDGRLIGVAQGAGATPAAAAQAAATALLAKIIPGATAPAQTARAAAPPPPASSAPPSSSAHPAAALAGAPPRHHTAHARNAADSAPDDGGLHF